MWFTRKHSPTIINLTKHSIVVFQERGFLYNKAVLLPGEAVSMTPSQTTGNVPLLSYYIHAVVGDERSLPTRAQSVKNLVCVSVIPAAFICATLVTASSAGAAAAPSTAMMSLLRGMVIKGVVIDSAALAAGALAANRAAYVSDMLLKKHPTKFMTKSGKMKPGKRFVIVTGGMEDGNLTISTIRERQFRKMGIHHFKEPTDTITDKIHYYIPVLAPSKKSQAALPSSAVPPALAPAKPQAVPLPQLAPQAESLYPPPESAQLLPQSTAPTRRTKGRKRRGCLSSRAVA
jgi:hypothetical protein